MGYVNPLEGKLPFPQLVSLPDFRTPSHPIRWKPGVVLGKPGTGVRTEVVKADIVDDLGASVSRSFSKQNQDDNMYPNIFVSTF